LLKPKANAEEFYKAHGKVFKRLSQAAEKYLFIPATSVACERLFSHSAFQVNKIKT
jgi:hypothetical protein